MNIDLKIAPLYQGDISAVCELYNHSIRCNPAGFIQDLNYHGCLIEKCKAWRASGGEMMVASLAGEVVGIGALAPQQYEHAELCKLHVAAKRQGLGIGRRLCETLIDFARQAGFRAIDLHVTMTQKAAVGLYRSLGFYETSRRIFTANIEGECVSFDTIYMSRSTIFP